MRKRHLLPVVLVTMIHTDSLGTPVAVAIRLQDEKREIRLDENDVHVLEA